MKIKTILSGFIAATMMAGISSCEGYLDLTPSNKLPAEGGITTVADADAAMNGAYQALTSAAYYGTDFVVRGDVSGEDVQTASLGKRTENFYRFIYRQANSPEGLWYIPYKCINRINTVLEAINSGVIPASEALNNIKGEALALRALCHFNTTIVYGYPYQKDNGASLGAPIVKKLLNRDDLLTRSTVAECYKSVEEDLDEALDLISDKVNEGHLNKWAVLGLKARLCLYKGDYDNAFKHAREIIEKGPYELVANKDYVSSWGNEYTSESIFDLHISQYASGNRELIGYLCDPKGYGALAATDEYIELLNENKDDVRINLLVADGQNHKYIINKYPGRDGKSTVNNMRIVRLSEIYLLAAEAALRKSTPDQNKANEYLKEIQKRAIPSTGDVFATLDLVNKERRKELALEGYRLYDILRDNKTVTREGGRHFLNKTDLITVSWSDYRCVLPIPQAEIDINHNIASQQNPGY